MTLDTEALFWHMILRHCLGTLYRGIVLAHDTEALSWHMILRHCLGT